MRYLQRDVAELADEHADVTMSAAHQFKSHSTLPKFFIWRFSCLFFVLFVFLLHPTVRCAKQFAIQDSDRVVTD